MSELHNHMLWLAIVWPLLLALSGLALPGGVRALTRPVLAAIIPASALLLLPGNADILLPQAFLGMGLALDDSNRWVLAMLVLVWLVLFLPGMVQTNDQQHDTQKPAAVLLMMTLAGACGLVLATDLIGFYSFSALMGYSFYGLLVQANNASAHAVGRLYIMALLVADVALLEAMLHANLHNNHLHFDTVRQAMGESASPLYVAMVILAFVLKAGIWPVHWWLLAGYQVAVPSVMILLAGIPVAMGLFGMTTWLPLGKAAFLQTGTLLQGLGGVAVLYSSFRLITSASASLRTIPAWSVNLLSGLYLLLTGTGLAYPGFWQSYGFLMPPLLVITGLTGAVFGFIGARQPPPASPPIPAAQLIARLQQWITQGAKLLTRKKALLAHQLNNRWNGIRSGWSGLTDKSSAWQTFSTYSDRWSVKIMLFVVLGLVLGLVLAGSTQL